MFELPLFPLNTVLFPGLPLHLHIFEDRYKLMMQRVMESEQTFGVVLIRRGLEANGPLAEPHKYGCTARIVEVQPLLDGRMELVAFGTERIHIISYNQLNQPYLLGQVDYNPLHYPSKDILDPLIDKLRPWVDHYLRRLAEVGDLKNAMQELPENSASLLYLSAALLQIPPGLKQQYLEVEDAVELTTSLITAYRRESALLGALLSSRGSGMRGFSSN